MIHCGTGEKNIGYVNICHFWSIFAKNSQKTFIRDYLGYLFPGTTVTVFLSPPTVYFRIAKFLLQNTHERIVYNLWEADFLFFIANQNGTTWKFAFAPFFRMQTSRWCHFVLRKKFKISYLKVLDNPSGSILQKEFCNSDKNCRRR